MSNIEWTDTTWNPVVGCTPVSPGCLNCYAATMARRLEAMGRPEYQPRVEPERKTMPDAFGVRTIPARTFRIAEVRNGRAVFTGDVRVVEDRLTDPLHWRKPRRVFVNSMSDLFHEDVPFAFIDRVFAVMALCPQHQFQVLTKRPERMAEYLDRHYMPGPVCDVAATQFGRYLHRSEWKEHADGRYKKITPATWPIPNVWLGTSVEDQARADDRIPHLLRCPAAVRFLSCEPLLGPVKPQLIQWDPTYGDEVRAKIGWVILGGESGPYARPCDVAWIRSIVRQCADVGVPCFVKQLGARPYITYTTASVPGRGQVAHSIGGHEFLRLKDRKGGDPSEWPEDLRVRQFPEVRQ